MKCEWGTTPTLHLLPLSHHLAAVCSGGGGGSRNVPRKCSRWERRGWSAAAVVCAQKRFGEAFDWRNLQLRGRWELQVQIHGRGGQCGRASSRGLVLNEVLQREKKKTPAACTIPQHRQRHLGGRVQGCRPESLRFNLMACPVAPPTRR